MAAMQKKTKGHSKQAVILSLRKQRILKLIHIHVRAGGEWGAAQAAPAPHATLPKPNNPETQGFLVSINHSECYSPFNHDVCVLENPP